VNSVPSSISDTDSKRYVPSFGAITKCHAEAPGGQSVDASARSLWRATTSVSLTPAVVRSDTPSSMSAAPTMTLSEAHLVLGSMC
jgi:hypothetical protein